jgi:hypothetical protein
MKTKAIIRVGVYWKDGPGWGRTFWPFAQLVVGPRELVVKQVIDRFSFRRKEVLSVKKMNRFPFPLNGIEILHNKGVYPARIFVYSPIYKAQKLIDQLTRLRFGGAAAE